MKRERKKTNKEQSMRQTGKSVQSKVPAQPDSGAKQKLLWLFAIALITFVAYFSSLDNEITSWDDEFYLNKNPYLKDISFEKVKTLFKTDTYYMGNYHPLAMISLSVDYAIGGEDSTGNIKPFMFHLTNLLLHIAISLCVFQFIFLLFKNLRLAGFAALLFGVHTLHVESVAWISERKDVLYAFFFMLSLISYLKYVDKNKLGYYIASFFLFLLSLFSKGQAVSLAVTLLLIDYLRGRNLLNKKLILEKIPFFVLAFIFGLIAISAQKHSEALVDEQGYTFLQRLAIGGFAFMTYIKELILPINLSAINPYPDIIHQSLPPFYYFMIIPAAATAFLFFYFLLKKKKTETFAIGFFIVNIFLLLQFIPVGSAVHSDRYVYIPSLAYVLLLAFLAEKLIEKKKKIKSLVFGIVGIYITLLSVLTWQRCNIWQNSETLWKDTVKKSPNSVVAQNNLGSWYDREASQAEDKLDFDKAKKLRLKAIEYFTTAIKGKPDYKNAFYNRGVSSFEVGKLAKDTGYIRSSIADFDKALQFDAQFADAYHNRGNAKAELGELETALADLDLAVSFNPSDAKFYVNRGVTKGKSNDLNGAIADFNKALQLDVEDKSTIYSNLGKAKMMQGKIDAALNNYDLAINLNPNHYTSYLNRALAKQKKGDFAGSLADFEKCLEINPKMGGAYYNRALLYLQMNKKSNACKDFKQASDLGIAYAKVLLQQYCK